MDVSLVNQFLMAAKTDKPRFITHRDWVNNQYMVYVLQNGREDYVKSFDELGDAQDFCDINNGVIATEAGR